MYVLVGSKWGMGIIKFQNINHLFSENDIQSCKEETLINLELIFKSGWHKCGEGGREKCTVFL
jgi:hypothetical protein